MTSKVAISHFRNEAVNENIWFAKAEKSVIFFYVP